MTDIELEDCNKCDGTGRLKVVEECNYSLYTDWRTCNKCWGKGKLDWIEQIVGIKLEEIVNQFDDSDLPF